MGPLLLLTSVLLSSWSVTGKDTSFTLKAITLSIEPGPNVPRGTNVTMRCKVSISSRGPLSQEYTIFKDTVIVYTKIINVSEDLLYLLPDVRVSNTGKYSCSIRVQGQEKTSEAKRLNVTGLSPPRLELNKELVNEGEELIARCSAPGETGLLMFNFFKDSKEIKEERINSNRLETKLHFNRNGTHEIHCTYTVIGIPFSFKSTPSNIGRVKVKELPIKPVLEIFPRSKIYEGDTLDITCFVENFPRNRADVVLFLNHGSQVLRSGDTKYNHSMTALGNHSGEFECRLEIGLFNKVATKMVSVTELFSVPTLTMSPTEVLQRESMTLWCKSENYARERIRREDLIYTLDPPESSLTERDTGEFSGKALPYEFNYTCTAQAKGIRKHSKTLTVSPKVSVSPPNISVVGSAVLGKPFQIQCLSEIGSLPINYTLVKANKEIATTTVKHPFRKAVFNVTIRRPEDINAFKCTAKNSHRDVPPSRRLEAPVTVPLSHPTLTVIPNPGEISEGDHLYLICGVRGTPPVTFKLYRAGINDPVFTANTSRNNTDFQVQQLAKEDSGTYHCEAVNSAENIVRSAPVTIEVRLATWKKAVIGGFSLLAVSVLVVVCVLCFRSKRGKKEAPAELSVKPSSPKSDDSLTVSLTHDTEVYNAAPATVDSVPASVWSVRPPDAGNDEESSMVSNELDVEYTEVVHPQPADLARETVPLRKGTETVYSELQNNPHAISRRGPEKTLLSPRLTTVTKARGLPSRVQIPNKGGTGAVDHHDYQGSVEYADLNGEQVGSGHYRGSGVNNYQDLPEPVD